MELLFLIHAPNWVVKRVGQIINQRKQYQQQKRQ